MPKVRSGERLKQYRQSYNYRSEYFKRNPGLFGCVWFCSQCYRPLIGKKQVIIDHIVPLSKGGRNHVSNCTAICQKCNRAKSDKVDGRIVKGYGFKLFESTLFRSQRGIGAAVGLTAGLTAAAAGGAARTGTGIVRRTFTIGGKAVVGLLKGVTFPLRKGNLGSRVLFLVFYTLVVLYLLSTYTDILDAWMR